MLKLLYNRNLLRESVGNKMAKKLKRKGMQWLRLIHLVSISIWFGVVIAIGLLAIISFFKLNEANFLIIAPLIPVLYQKIVLPIALITIIQGIIYGVFTNWGFFKHRWLLLKWCLVPLIALCTGMGTIGPIFTSLDKVKKFGFVGGFTDGGVVLFFIALQILFMLFMFVLSVFKPFKKSKQNIT